LRQSIKQAPIQSDVDNAENKLVCLHFSTDICSGMVHLWRREKGEAGGHYRMRSTGKRTKGMKGAREGVGWCPWRDTTHTRNWKPSIAISTSPYPYRHAHYSQFTR
jgi:hypothetical protein